MILGTMPTLHVVRPVQTSSLTDKMSLKPSLVSLLSGNGSRALKSVQVSRQVAKSSFFGVPSIPENQNRYKKHPLERRSVIIFNRHKKYFNLLLSSE